MDLVRNMLKNALLAFVLVTVGFAIGKETTIRSTRHTSAKVPAIREAGQAAGIDIYYLHAMVRCATCNSIERMTHEVLTSRFAAELADGRINWRVANFQEDEKLAKRFQVVSSGVIVARTDKEGKESYRSLDDVWTLIDDPAAFKKYVAKAVREYLSAGSKEENVK